MLTLCQAGAGGAGAVLDAAVEAVRTAADSIGSAIDPAANLLTILTIAAGFVVTRGFWVRRSLSRARRRAYSAAPHLLSIRRRAHKARVQELTTGGAHSTASDELNWLCGALARGDDDTAITQQLTPSELRGTAMVYRRLAANLDTRILLSPRVEAIAQQRDLATQTAQALEHLATGDSRTAPQPLRFSAVHRATRWVLHAYPGIFAGHSAFDLSVAYRRHLTSVDYPDSPWRDTTDFTVAPLSVNDEELEALLARRDEGHFFDGVLPRVTYAQTTRDHSSGRARLSMSIAACTYYAVVTDHYPSLCQVEHLSRHTSGAVPKARGVRQRAVNGSEVGLLTLALVPVTADGYLIFAERGQAAGSHEGLFGPGVNGNLELWPRQGVLADADRFGLPDPLSAISREAREELGLVIAPEDIHVVGLTTFDSPTERGTQVLLTTTRLPHTLDEIVERTENADLIEGRWELGGSILGVRMPQADAPAKLIRDRAAWLRDCTGLTPHATAAGLASMAAYRGDLVWQGLRDAPPLAGEIKDPDWLVRVPLR
jgi:hypothetical protein